MNRSRWLLLSTVTAALLAFGSADRAEASIIYVGTGSYSPGGYSTYTVSVNNSAECTNMGGTPICSTGPIARTAIRAGGARVQATRDSLDLVAPPESCTNATQCELLQYNPPRYTNTRSDDLMIWKNSAPTSAAGKLQGVAFGGYAAHAGMCYSADSGGCLTIFENNANDPAAAKNCSPWDEMYDTLVAGIAGVNYYSASAFVRSGTLHIFRETSSTRIAEMRTRRSAAIGQKYFISSYSDERNYGQCGSTLGAAYNLTRDEGRGTFSASSTEVSALLPAMYDTMYNHISGKVEGEWNFWASVGCFFTLNFKGEVKTKLTRNVLNVFLNDTTASSWDPPYPRTRTVQGVTAPVLLETWLRPELACVPKTCAQLGRTCGTWGDTCGGIASCGTCSTGGGGGGGGGGTGSSQPYQQ